MLGRRVMILSGLAMALAVAACSGQAKAPLDAAGQPLEGLKVRTASGEHVFWVEIADDDAERERGLMFRPPLEDDRGMLFQFADSQERGFWMRNTPSSLDIVYVAADGKIVSIARHTTPFSEQNVPSNGPAKGVLEVRAGRMDEIGAKPGDVVSHPFFGN